MLCVAQTTTGEQRKNPPPSCLDGATHITQAGIRIFSIRLDKDIRIIKTVGQIKIKKFIEKFHYLKAQLYQQCQSINQSINQIRFIAN
jgi:hypothetical protein